MKKVFERTVQPVKTGTRLDVYLKQSGIGLSRNKIIELIKQGKVKVDGRVVRKPSHKVRAGEHIVVEYELPEEVPLVAQDDLEVEIIYEDEEIIVINKPVGMVVHPAKGHFTGTVVNALLSKITHIGGSSDRLRPGIVHRLDKDTSGVMVIAKTERAVRSLSRQIQERTMKRIYLAVVWGNLPKSKGTIEAPIGRHPIDRKRMTITPFNSKPAITHYKVKERFMELASLLEVHLDTGRMHQIRVHMEYLGHPVVGDPTYSGREYRKIFRVVPSLYAKQVEEILNLIQRQALHAYKLILEHPTKDVRMEFEAKLPEDMDALMNYLYTFRNDKDKVAEAR